MKPSKPQRIAVIGLPGSGKSTFAYRLSRLFNYPVHHLDKHYFLDSGEKRDSAEFISLLRQMVEGDAWIIEGCATSTFEMRFARADMVFCFRLPRLTCIWRVIKRLFTRHGACKKMEDGSAQFVNWALIQYIWNFERDKGNRIEELRKRYPHVGFRVFKSSKEAEEYLSDCTKER